MRGYTIDKTRKKKGGGILSTLSSSKKKKEFLSRNEEMGLEGTRILKLSVAISRDTTTSLD
jgi:hypothetical protein